MSSIQNQPVPNTPRAILYARVSTTYQDSNLQIEALRKTADIRGWNVVAEYIDDGVSGSKSKRPNLDRLMADVRAGRADVVAVWRFDRFARSTRHLLEALHEFSGLGVDFVSCQENIDTSTAIGRMVFTMTSAIAEFERELIRERVSAGVRKARADGVVWGRPVKELDLRPVRAMLDTGYSVAAIARSLNVSRRTLTRRLQEEGLLPKDTGSAD